MSEGELKRPPNTSNPSRERLKKVFKEFIIDNEPRDSKDDLYHKSFLGNSSFANRLSLFILISIVAICSFSALFYHTDQLLSNSLQQVRVASQIASLVAKIESGVTALNSDSGNFIFNEDLRYARNYKKRSEILAQDLKLLIEDPAALEFQKIATTVNDAIAQHGNQFAYIVKIKTLLGLDDKIGMSANAVASIAILDKKLGEFSSLFKDGIIKDYLNQIKTDEMQLKSNPTLKNLQPIEITIKSLNEAILSLSVPKSKKKILIILLQSHKDDIAQLARTRITYLEQIKQLGEISAYTVLNLDKLMIYAGNFSLLVRQDSINSQNYIRQILAGGSSGIIIALIISGIILMISVSMPARRTIETALELARGNVSAPIPYLGNFDETGELSKSLIFFRQNMLDADRLRKNLEVIINKEATLIPPKTLGSLDDEQDTSIEDFSDVPTIPQITLGKTAMTEIGQQLTTTSRNASDAAEEAERTEIIVSGLDDAKDKIEDIEKLMIGISDQMSLLAVQTALTDTENKEAENLVHLDEKRDRTKFSSKIGSGQSVNDRIETIQGGTKRAIKAAQIISVTINEVNEVAKEFSTAASREALTAANELLRQSHELRAMLDNLLDRVDTENSAFSQSKTKD